MSQEMDQAIDAATSTSSVSLPLRYITELRPTDVLLGRGVPISNYSGNIIFRRLVNERRASYSSSCRHRHKNTIANELIKIIEESNGRFVREVKTSAEAKTFGVPPGTKAWIFVDEETVIQKVKQALRETSGTAETMSPSMKEDSSFDEPRTNQSSSTDGSPDRIPGSEGERRNSEEGEGKSKRKFPQFHRAEPGDSFQPLTIADQVQRSHSLLAFGNNDSINNERFNSPRQVTNNQNLILESFNQRNIDLSNRNHPNVATNWSSDMQWNANPRMLHSLLSEAPRNDNLAMSGSSILSNASLFSALSNTSTRSSNQPFGVRQLDPRLFVGDIDPLTATNSLIEGVMRSRRRQLGEEGVFPRDLSASVFPQLPSLPTRNLYHRPIDGEAFFESLIASNQQERYLNPLRHQIQQNLQQQSQQQQQLSVSDMLPRTALVTAAAAAAATHTSPSHALHRQLEDRYQQQLSLQLANAAVFQSNQVMNENNRLNMRRQLAGIQFTQPTVQSTLNSVFNPSTELLRNDDNLRLHYSQQHQPSAALIASSLLDENANISSDFSPSQRTTTTRFSSVPEQTIDFSNDGRAFSSSTEQPSSNTSQDTEVEETKEGNANKKRRVSKRSL